MEEVVSSNLTRSTKIPQTLTANVSIEVCPESTGVQYGRPAVAAQLATSSTEPVPFLASSESSGALYSYKEPDTFDMPDACRVSLKTRQAGARNPDTSRRCVQKPDWLLRILTHRGVENRGPQHCRMTEEYTKTQLNRQEELPRLIQERLASVGEKQTSVVQ
jgi:hypothetical protein